jgi:hypothetical protein
MSEEDFQNITYHERQMARSERAVGIVLLGWIYLMGAVCGWIVRGLIQ